MKYVSQSMAVPNRNCFERTTERGERRLSFCSSANTKRVAVTWPFPLIFSRTDRIASGDFPLMTM